MIPVRLELRDFLSYADPAPIDFTSFDVACVSGPNGVGKSALLLDSITWALFGAARGCEGGQNQDRLIRDGAEETSVDFTFSLNASTYRIVRTRGRKTGSGGVRLTMLTAEGWTNLAGDSIRETEQRIGSLLRMDYRTFVTSAFFVQGRADDFLSRMKPEDRKDVFVKLLDLASYDLLEEAARERARIASRQSMDLIAQADRLAGSIEDPERLEAELAAAQAEVQGAEALIEEAESDARAAREVVGALGRQETLLIAEQRALDELADRLGKADITIESHERDLGRLDELLARADEVAQALEEMEGLRAEEEMARASRDEAAKLNQQISVLEERTRNDRASLDRQLADLERRISSLDTELAKLGDVDGQLRDASASLESSAGIADELAAAGAELDRMRTHEGEIASSLAALGARSDEIRDKLELLRGGAGTCPLCGEALDASHAKKITSELRTSASSLKAKQKAAESELGDVRKKIKAAVANTKLLEKAVGERQAMLGRLEMLNASAERAAAIRTEIETLGVQGAELKEVISSENYASAAKAEISDLSTRARKIYDSGAHGRLSARLETLRPFEGLQGRLEEAGTQRGRVAAALEEAVAAKAQLTTSIAQRRSVVTELADKITGLAPAREQVARLEGLLLEARQAAAGAGEARGRLSERLKAAELALEQSQEARLAARDAAAAHRHYDRLRSAFGRGGIPDLIIENALPALRDEANDILGRLSDFDMSLQFLMTKQTKGGKARDTFDVLVTHDGGSRDFQMFSGGEAFRIAFAVRLGLSKLLVRRSGARLETLIIDEGFGTQDPEGRERLVEAISLARSEFSKVLVITHLDEMKDLFDTQIRVEKGPKGSTVEVLNA